MVWRVGYELSLLLGRLPTLLAGLPTLADGWSAGPTGSSSPCPFSSKPWARDALEGLLEQGIALPNRFYDALAGAVTGLASALPAAALFLFTTVLATYFTSAGRPALLDGLRRRLPPPWRTRLGPGGRRSEGGAGRLAESPGPADADHLRRARPPGFLLLRVELSLLLAGLVALVDALPVFGTGTVLLPWAVLALLGGDVRMSVGLLVLYSVISLVRSLLEPRLVGARVGLPSPGCPGLHVCGLSGARSSWNASRPTGRRAGPAALGFRPPAQPVRTLSKQPAGTCRGLFVSLFRTIRRDIGLVRGRLHRRGYGRRCGACAGLGWIGLAALPGRRGLRRAVPRWARWPGSPGQNSRTWGSLTGGQVRDH